jgi:hypothetical protein
MKTLAFTAMVGCLVALVSVLSLIPPATSGARALDGRAKETYKTATAYPITIRNDGPNPLYIRGFAGSDLLLPDNEILQPKSQKEYTVTLPWMGGRIYACWNNTKAHDIIKGQNANYMMLNCGWIEATVQSGGVLSSNITFVDAISLPIRLEAVKGAYCSNSGSVTAYFDITKASKNCPTYGDGKYCLSAYQFCSSYCINNPDSEGCNTAFCSKFDSVIQDCKSKYSGCNAGNANTVDVYGCTPTSFFGSAQGEPYCMAINRGILSSYDDQGNSSKFYKNPPYNTYASFVHAVAGDIFAISYDDYPATQNNGGYCNCQSSAGLKVTFYPDPVKLANSYLGNGYRPGGPDADVFKFSGKTGERVTLELKSDVQTSKKACLMLKGPGLAKKTRGTLPRKIKAKLPRTGVYEITVHNAGIPKETRFVGDYCLGMASSIEAWRTFKPKLSQEGGRP